MVSLGSIITAKSQPQSQTTLQSQAKSKSLKTPERMLKDFISIDPKAGYTFDSERDSSESEICRQQFKQQQQQQGNLKGNEKEKGYEECINLRMNSKKLFATMQEYGYFCALPSNPEKTHMECKPMP